MANRALQFVAAVLLICVAVVEGVNYKTKIVAYEDGVGGQTSLFSKSGEVVTGITSAGDTVTLYWTLRDRSNIKVGKLTGYCVYTTSVINICTVTYLFPGGSITVSGAEDDTEKVHAYPIVGGTGKYSGAKGYITSTTISATPGKQKYADVFYLM